VCGRERERIKREGEGGEPGYKVWVKYIKIIYI
jgi:hypothetical protein